MARGKKTNGNGRDEDGDGFRESVNGEHNYGDLGARLAETVDAIEAEEAKIEKLAEQHKQRCTPIREQIKRIKKAANEAGLNATPLNAVLRRRRFERKAAEVSRNMDEEQKDEFRVMLDAHSDFLANTELGRAAEAASVRKGPVQPANAH